MNNITKFSSSLAQSYAESMKAKIQKLADKKANRIIAYIEARYTKEIRKAIKKNVECKQIKISLPYFLVNDKGSTFRQIERVVKEHFNKLGFTVSINNNCFCDCAIDFICNRYKAKVYINW